MGASELLIANKPEITSDSIETLNNLATAFVQLTFNLSHLYLFVFIFGVWLINVIRIFNDELRSFCIWMKKGFVGWMRAVSKEQGA